jgi:hypothetical protein
MMSKDDDPRMQTGTTCVPLPQTLRIKQRRNNSPAANCRNWFFFFGFWVFFFLFLCKQKPKTKTKRKNPNTRKKLTQGKTNTRQELHNQKQQKQQKQQ